ncbi:MAG: PDR/VanB family oxidoreductase [Gordonia sp. (in: high G+C Gram-positive bacteria)]|uniref:PDR/VanB family oxidoreductase n=1 Tax=Gordonia sp. (in: high G+C Gram-positive bacteria) TaxID=84139 RepID=UPI0039E4E596
MSTGTVDAYVHAITYAGTDLLSYDLRPVDPDAGLPPFDAGAHVDVHVAPGLIRQYSLCNDPSERHRYVVCVHRDASGRGGSRTLHDTVRVGQALRVGEPRNHFALRSADRYVLMAGGVGVTPLAAMAARLHDDDADFELHVYARDRAHVPLRELLTSSSFAGRTTVHLSSDGDGLRDGPPPALAQHRPGTVVYTCGPAGFMDAVAGYARTAGYTDDDVVTERFAPSAAAAGDPAADGSFDVVVASTSQRIPVTPECSIAEALAESGIQVDLSCEQGMCGACLTPVISGVPDHRDDVQSAAEQAANTHITLCCSRAKTAELVLDL